MPSNLRWLTSLHEAGHAAAAIALGGKAIRITVGDDHTGLCHTQLDHDSDRTFMVAAGPIAQELLGDAPAPSEELDSSEPQTPRILPFILDEPCRGLIAAKDVTEGHEVESDDRKIALWAIKGHEDQPERWAERVVFVKHVAGQIVADHKQEILRIACALYFRSALFEEEIHAAFKGAT